jgi:hypothetical protein
MFKTQGNFSGREHIKIFRDNKQLFEENPLDSRSEENHAATNKTQKKRNSRNKGISPEAESDTDRFNIQLIGSGNFEVDSNVKNPNT